MSLTRRRWASLLIMIVVAVIMAVHPLAQADQTSWDTSGSGNKYARSWSRIQWHPQISPWDTRKIIWFQISGSRGGSPTVVSWRRDFVGVGISYSGGSTISWAYTSHADGPSKTNWNCDSAGSGCIWDDFIYGSGWSSIHSSSYLISRVTTKASCNSPCVDFSTTRSNTLYAPNL